MSDKLDVIIGLLREILDEMRRMPRTEIIDPSVYKKEYDDWRRVNYGEEG